MFFAVNAGKDTKQNFPIVTAPGRNNLMTTKEPRSNEPLYSGVLGIITNNIFFAVVIIKRVGMNLDITKPQYS